MNRKEFVSILIILIFITLLFSGCIRRMPDDPNTTVKSIEYDGLNRSYRIHVPPNLNNSTLVPLLFVLHGGGGTGEGMEEQLTEFGFNELSDNYGFIVVYPDGIERHWNDGRKNTTYRAHQQNIDDVGFISTLIDIISDDYSIDPNRIYSTGISNGAMMSFRLACELSEKIAAVAPVAGAMPLDLQNTCQPSKPVSALIISGTDDPLVPWEGGYITYNNRKLGKVLSVPETVSYWVGMTNCTATPDISWLPDFDPSDGTTVKVEIYNHSTKNVSITLYQIEGGGHTWPGGYQYYSVTRIGKTCRDFDANEAIWQFFSNHPK